MVVVFGSPNSFSPHPGKRCITSVSSLIPHAPFGACPSAVKFLGTSGPATMVRFSDGSEVDPDIEQVQITGGFSQGGSTRVSYRLFRVDSNAVFGLTELGTGLGDWDASSEHILVREQPRFATDLDFGNASWVEGGYAYLWGCNAPGHYLTEGCLLARREAYDRVDVYLGAQAMGRSDARPRRRDRVRRRAVDLGRRAQSEREQRSAARVRQRLYRSLAGPAREFARRAVGQRCPTRSVQAARADEKSYCAGPVLHQELADPTRPNELVVSYGVASTGTGTGARLDYWSRLAWLSQ